MSGAAQGGDIADEHLTGAALEPSARTRSQSPTTSAGSIGPLICSSVTLQPLTEGAGEIIARSWSRSSLRVAAG